MDAMRLIANFFYIVLAGLFLTVMTIAAQSTGERFSYHAAAREGVLACDHLAGRAALRSALSIGVFLLITLAALVSRNSSPGLIVFRLIEAFLIAAMLCVDVRFRYLPIELSVSLGAVGMAALILFLRENMLANLLIGVFLGLTAAFLSRFEGRNGGPSIGGGDAPAFLAVSLASGSDCLLGAFACFLSAAIWGLFTAVRNAGNAGNGASGAFPMAPFLAIWFVVSLAGVSVL